MSRARAKEKRGAPKGNQNARKHGFYDLERREMSHQSTRQVHKLEGAPEIGYNPDDKFIYVKRFGDALYWHRYN